MPLGSVVIPAKAEGSWFLENLMELDSASRLCSEILVVVDDASDPTVELLTGLMPRLDRLRVLVNSYGPGPANAIRFGIDKAQESVVVVFMADGCDDPQQVDELVRLVARGVSVACASRYASGGQQVGGPRFKRFLSKLAGQSFKFLTGVGTRDATNSFKAYSTEFVRTVGIQSRSGFEVGLELVAKAKRRALPIAEIPTIWIDKSLRVSNFKLAKWIPKYLKWYLYGLLPWSIEKR